ncbi:RNA polymerase sigma-70 factor [Sphingobacterium sp.]|uniref:RNA polymerase sigma factor n=1 Tax=Sphingobacterium sp. TaxID=341027 RepID=UPI0028A17DC2|nr:RNA polymerase sigma-70 factor [Sphingobacterium sp.]
MNSCHAYSDKELIISLKKNNQLAFRHIFDIWHKKLYHFSIRYLHHKEHAEEIVHDTLVKLWSFRHNLDENRPIGALLFTICKRLCLNRLRDAAKLSSISEELWSNYSDITNNTEEALQLTELRKLTDLAVNKLSKQQQLIFKMSREEGLSHIEIAEKLNISKETVKKHSADAVKFLKAYLKKYLQLLLMFFF